MFDGMMIYARSVQAVIDGFGVIVKAETRPLFGRREILRSRLDWLSWWFSLTRCSLVQQGHLAGELEPISGCRRNSAKADRPFIEVFAPLRNRNHVDGATGRCCDVRLPFLVGGASVSIRQVALFPHVDFLDLCRDTPCNKFCPWNTSSTKQQNVQIKVPASPIDHGDQVPDRFVDMKNSCLVGSPITSSVGERRNLSLPSDSNHRWTPTTFPVWSRMAKVILPR